VGALIATATSVPAQAQDEDRDQDCVCPRVNVGGVYVAPRLGDAGRNVFYFGQRARLGVYIHTEANPETDRYGALIDDVSEDGPADKAGIRAGDIIIELDGNSVLEGFEDYDLEGAPGQELSGPGQRLSALARELEMGDTVTVKYRRDGDEHTAELVVGDFEGYAIGWTSEFNDSMSDRFRTLSYRLRELPEVQIQAPRNFAIAIGERVPGLELVELNPDLGEYFGTDEGLLVLSAPEDSELGLIAGDVIQAIDGRAVQSPSHAMRILRSYEEDEEVTFQIYRQKRSRTVTGKVPENFFGGAFGIRTREP
jgi:hypothetical protein